MAQVISSEEFNNLVEHIEGIAVVDFFATWCGPCKMLAPVFQEVANEFEGKADFYKIDIDASLDIARQFSVSTVPTVIIFRNGEPIERLVGFMPKENLASKIKEYIYKIEKLYKVNASFVEFFYFILNCGYFKHYY